MEIISVDGWYLLLRWIHFLAGITWIGLLYYFNFVQGEWFKETDASAKNAAVQKLVPRALWWFRWSAMFTFLAGALTLITKGMQVGWGIYESSWGIVILTGSVLGTLMFLNVWLIIWPKQQIVIASANQVIRLLMVVILCLMLQNVLLKQDWHPEQIHCFLFRCFCPWGRQVIILLM